MKCTQENQYSEVTGALVDPLPGEEFDCEAQMSTEELMAAMGSSVCEGKNSMMY